MNLVESWMNTDASLNNQPIRIGVVFYKQRICQTAIFRPTNLLLFSDQSCKIEAIIIMFFSRKLRK